MLPNLILQRTVVTRQKSRFRICKTTVQIIQRKSENAKLSDSTIFPRQTVRQKKSPNVTADEDKIEKIKKRTHRKTKHKTRIYDHTVVTHHDHI